MVVAVLFIVRKSLICASLSPAVRFSLDISGLVAARRGE
jgi:hypothetical protein